MRVRSLAFALFGVIGAFPAACQGAAPDGATPGSGGAAEDPAVLMDSVRFALECELKGNDVDRNSLLQHVLQHDPEFAPARWQLGYLKVNDDRWVPYERSVDDEDERFHRLFLYRKNREGRGDTVRDHLYMADGARSRGMGDEERAHLMRVVELDWDHEEARQRLQHVKLFDGSWMTREDAEDASQYAAFVEQSLIDWVPTTARIAESLYHDNRRARERGEDELAALRDPCVIPAVEAVFLSRGLEREYLDWLAACGSWEASVAMARLAVASDSAALRVAAQTLLKERRLDDYVPVLLDLLCADPNVEWQLMETRKRWLVLVQTVSYGDAEANYQYVNRAWYRPEILFVRERDGSLRNVGDRMPSVANNLSRRRQALQHAGDGNRRFFYDVTQRVIQAEWNNDRVARCLTAATGVAGPETPAEWWAWWNERNVVFTAGEKPLYQIEYEQKWAVDRYDRVVRSRDVVQASCFAAGTPVVTEYGLKPIEEIVLGDRVLAQDTESGEIAFKPVFKTTVRPPVELLQITTGDGELVCTGGHPFWVNGLGWRYAWELEPGMRLHAVDGSSEIIAIEDSGRTGEAYNLVVADFHNYFAGEGRILSHDNSPRNPTNALVPGLMRDWSAAVPE